MSESDNTNLPTPMIGERPFASAGVPVFLLKQANEIVEPPLVSPVSKASEGDPFAFRVQAAPALPVAVLASPVPAAPLSVPSIRQATFLDADDPDVQAQFRLRRLQAYNWGTFQGVADFPIASEGYPVSYTHLTLPTTPYV